MDPDDQESHVKNTKYEGKKTRILMTCQQTRNLKGWKLNTEQQQLVAASGLGHLALIMEFVADRFLLTAFSERWRKETNTAHFPGFEMAPSLRDVSYIMGLSVTGKLVTGEPVGPSGVERLCKRYLGRIPQSEDTKCGWIRLSWLYNEFHILPDNPSVDAIAYSTRAYLIHLIGCTLFTEAAKGFVSPRYLPLLSNFSKISEYAWGVAALAHLYRGLSIAGAPSAKLSEQLLGGSATLLLAWLYEHLPVVRPKLKSETLPLLPRACMWKSRCGSFGPKSMSILKYRELFDLLQASDVNWTPYDDVDQSTLPEYCIASNNVCRARMWLISSHIKEMYVPERYARQFGEEQHIPNDVLPWCREGWSMYKDWRVEYADEIKEYHHLVETSDIIPFKFKEICTAERYSEWYGQITHPRIHKSPSNPRANVYPEDKFRMVAEGLKGVLPVINHHLEGLSLPIELVNSLKRLNELIDMLHSSKCFPRSNRLVRKRKRVLKDMGHKKEQEQLSRPTKPSDPPHPSSERLRQSSQPPQRQKKQDGISEQSEPAEASEQLQCSNSPSHCTTPECSGSAEFEPRKKQSRVLTEPRRRSGRLSTQIKGFKHNSGEGGDPSNPILL